MSRFFLLLAPEHDTKIDVLDGDEPAERVLLLDGAPEALAFLDGAAVGDFLDLDGKRERLLVRLGREWPRS
jgi:hypothetical protein